jgi:hypothetical protein
MAGGAPRRVRLRAVAGPVYWASVCRNRDYDVRPIDAAPGRAILTPLVLSRRLSLYAIGLVVVPTSFDVDLDTVTLLAVGLIVVIAFGVGWIVRGRR